MPSVIVPFRGDNFYLGFAEEATPGTPAAPTVFPRWLNGTSVEIVMDTEEITEGSGGRGAALLIKNGQKVKIKLVSSLRPNEKGYFLKWALGAGSDTYTGPTVNTTLSALTNAGATQITVAANTGLTTSGTIALALEAGSATEEIAVFNIPASGSGPYTLTVASTYNGGALRLAHSNSGAVKSMAQHVFTDQYELPYVTCEAGFANLFSAGGTALRIRSCKVDKYTFSSEKGKIHMDEIELTGIASTVQGTPATVTLEQHAPFLHTQGAWTLDSSTSGDAPNIRKQSIEISNNLDDDTQTEALTLSCLIAGKLDVTASYSAILTSFSRQFKTFFGSATGTTDSQTIGLGDLDVTFTQPDTLNTVRYKILTLAYTKAPFPEPNEDGKHWDVDVEGTSVVVPQSGSGSNNAYKLQTTLTNTQYGAY